MDILLYLSFPKEIYLNELEGLFLLSRYQNYFKHDKRVREPRIYVRAIIRKAKIISKLYLRCGTGGCSCSQLNCRCNHHLISDTVSSKVSLV